MLLLMIIFHIIDDFLLQGSLAKLKQKQWWEESAPDKLYKYDYIICLIIHAFEWSFMILLPFAFIQHFNYSIPFVVVLVFNTIIHAFIDNLKANKKAINLIIDQSLHLVQIIFTYLIMTLV